MVSGRPYFLLDKQRFKNKKILLTLFAPLTLFPKLQFVHDMKSLYLPVHATKKDSSDKV